MQNQLTVGCNGFYVNALLQYGMYFICQVHFFFILPTTVDKEISLLIKIFNNYQQNRMQFAPTISMINIE